MNSYLFGTGVPKFLVNEDEISIEKSFIESIELEPRDIEHESIINTTRNWTNKTDHDHLTITVLCRLHKITGALTWFKNFYSTYNKTEVDGFAPGQYADFFVDTDGEYVKFRLQITELFPLETPWAYDTFRIILRSKKPVDLGALQVTTTQITATDTDGTTATDTDGEAMTD
ncbi:hypothetical protein LDC_2477 [sediment metagenome]|uniref:Uncharacterized protein n=1 Tax=sediment metagenome TaxID=749907 RepID=D9PLQ4_9ZZZZ